MSVGLTHHMRLATVASTVPWHMSVRIGASLDGPWTPTLRIDANESIGDMVKRLNDWQPEMLVAYPSLARTLAEQQLAGRLSISPVVVFTGSEVLTSDTRHLLEAAWGKRVFDQYATTEAAGLAAECAHHAGMHLYEDLVITEVVDEHYRPVPAGTYGDKLLVTVLFKRAQPLIRYELTDSLRLVDAACPCGRPFALIHDIHGRTEEKLRFPGVTGHPVDVYPNAFHRQLDLIPAAG